MRETGERENNDVGEVANQSTKKVRFRVIDEDFDVEMTSAPTTTRPRSWKDYLMSTGLRADVQAQGVDNFYGEEDLELSEVDIVKSTVNGIPSINFSERVNQILIKDMAHTVVIKLLGRNIGYPMMYNKVCSLWKPSQSFRLMDLENGYFLAKFQSLEDFEKVLCQGPWIVYGQYLTVQPWSVDFNTSQSYLSLVMAWIRLPGFARAHVLINGVIQRVEYEYLTTMCFSCGHYGHIKELCPNKIDEQKAIEAGVANGQTFDATIAKKWWRGFRNNRGLGLPSTRNPSIRNRLRADKGLGRTGPSEFKINKYASGLEVASGSGLRMTNLGYESPNELATRVKEMGVSNLMHDGKSPRDEQPFSDLVDSGVEELEGTTMMELLQRSEIAEEQEDEERNTEGLKGTPPGSTTQPDLRPGSKSLQAVLGIPIEGILDQ
ncbi:hypothetical protein Gorai_003120 [Gossypium raimondii]|uniref:CCHC-type domain-containing protein n=1 Tax=Gossypium raimondii TaxID=29730 RepID=A0A7J8QNV5_GOSRA|nr:hypothetical protein [Gossypium raimondii]